jgi:hypothetical protein
MGGKGPQTAPEDEVGAASVAVVRAYPYDGASL